MKKLLVLFDFDGTIVDSFPVIKECANMLADKYGYPKMKSRPHLLPWYSVPAKELDAYIAEMRKLMQARTMHIRMFKGMAAVVKDLDTKGIRTGILTSSATAYIHEIAPTLPVHFTKTSTVFGKKELLQEYKKKWHVVYVGDEIRDVQSAKRAGCISVAVTWGFTAERILREQQPDYLVKTPKQLCSLLSDMQNKINDADDNKQKHKHIKR